MSDKEKEIDIDEEIKKISRKTEINIMNFQYSFENRIKKLEKEIDEVIKSQIKDFDNMKKLTSDYLSIDYSSSTIDRYRDKLKKI